MNLIPSHRSEVPGCSRPLVGTRTSEGKSSLVSGWRGCYKEIWREKDREGTCRSALRYCNKTPEIINLKRGKVRLCGKTAEHGSWWLGSSERKKELGSQCSSLDDLTPSTRPHLLRVPPPCNSAKYGLCNFVKENGAEIAGSAGQRAYFG